METIPISIFKAKCLAVLERVRRTGSPVLVTRRGVPVAQVGPPPKQPAKKSAFGAFKGTEIGDIVAPLPEDLWNVLR